jgi:magnesium-transporting ATPase (P-type)
MLHDVCVGKTGTLTKGQMNVQKFHICDDQDVKNNDPEVNPPNYFNSGQLDTNEDLKEIIRESIIANTDVRIEANDLECIYEPKGSAIEVCMIQFLMDNEEDIQSKLIARNQFSPKIVQLPFC